MSLGTSNRDGGKTSESGHLRSVSKTVSGDVLNGLNLSQRAAGANMSVDIAAGDAFVRRSDGSYAHPVFNDAVYNLVISAADGANPRRDIVVIYVDYAVTPSTAVSNNTNGVVKIKVVNGTPAGSPVDPTDAAIQTSVGAGNPWTKLGRVRVPAGQTSITNTLIDDLRSMSNPIMRSKSVTTDNILAGAGIIGGLLPSTNISSSLATFTDVLSITIPATSTPHKYLLITSVEISNGAGGGYAEYGVRATKQDGSIIANCYTDAAAGYWFVTIALNGIFVSSGENIKISASSNTTGRGINNRSTYSIVDLGAV